MVRPKVLQMITNLMAVPQNAATPGPGQGCVVSAVAMVSGQTASIEILTVSSPKGDWGGRIALISEQKRKRGAIWV